MSKEFLDQYTVFVDGVTSAASKDKDAFIARINELYDSGCDVARLTTAAAGLSSEGGEFVEVVKKILFHGKPYTEENVFHLKRELGDVIWYWTNACKALGLDPYEVIMENIDKLKSRYPGGFSIDRSEKRAPGDI